MKPSKTLCALLFVLAVPNFCFAQQCPGNLTGVGASVAHAGGTTVAPFAFIGAGCSGSVPTGTMPPSQCLAGTHSIVGIADFVAQWPSAAARTAAGTMDGCRFTCPGGPCFVRATDALPVELMEFAVDEEDSEK